MRPSPDNKSTASKAIPLKAADRLVKPRHGLQTTDLQVEEQLVDAGIVGEFGMERRSKNVALAQADHIAVD